MRRLTLRTLLLILLLGVDRGSIISNTPYSRVENKGGGGGQSSNNVHNVTVNCGDDTVLGSTVFRCSQDIFHLASSGFPWTIRGSQRNFRPNPTVTDKINTLRDALDSLNHTCHINDKSQSCLSERGIRDYCLVTTGEGGLFQMDFQFICHHRRRDENLVRFLQCLHDTRVLVMLYFHIADRCRGMGILDDMMRRIKNARFYNLNINPYWHQTNIPLLYCLPKSVISTCIRDIVQDQCGTMTADLVQNYLVYTQDWFGQA